MKAKHLAERRSRFLISGLRLSERTLRGGLVVLGIVLAGMAVLGLAQAAGSLDVRLLASDQYFSPNGDEQEDAVSVTYCLSQAANMDIWVTSGSGDRIRTIEDGVSHVGGSCGGSEQSHFEWDGKDDDGRVVADGVYTAHLKGRSSDVESGDVTIRFGVDARTPGALTAPTPGATLSGSVAWAFSPTAGFVLDRVILSCQDGSGGR